MYTVYKDEKHFLLTWGQLILQFKSLKVLIRLQHFRLSLKLGRNRLINCGSKAVQRGNERLVTTMASSHDRPLSFIFEHEYDLDVFVKFWTGLGLKWVRYLHAKVVCVLHSLCRVFKTGKNRLMVQQQFNMVTSNWSLHYY